MPRRKSKRRCPTSGCQGKPTLFPQCDACRKAGCQHLETHYDSSYAKVCNQCGTTIQAATKQNSKNCRSKGKKAGWQGNGIMYSRSKGEINTDVAE